jgi:dethiobiotin synthetase/adenosylmethionine--8-amino-7-oxononanoate aminotransferase
MAAVTAARRFASSFPHHDRLLRVNQCVHLIFGSNTDVGKTIISAGLTKVGGSNAYYIKPLQCGGSDEAFVEAHAPNVKADTLFSWKTPASPHVASIRENNPVSDAQVLSAIHGALSEIPESSTVWLETAGGVLSPSAASPENKSPKHAPSQKQWGWTTQADLYQPLIGAAPVVLVGDGRLGGISATLSSLESLILRGYTVNGIALIDGGYDNVSALRDYAMRQVKIRSGTGRRLFENLESSIVALPALPPEPEPLTQWYDSDEVSDTFEGFYSHLLESWKRQTQELEKMRSDGRQVVWWPFTQHGNFDDDSKVTLIDSASGDYFHVVKNDNEGNLVRQPQFDACASWWTQGVGHGESSLALSSAAAAGRYGHVIFPDNVHAPAVRLSMMLVDGPGKGWASRAFYTDDGSTAMEVAIKMGMKTYQKWHDVADEEQYNWIVAAQADCYHGDTLGVMDLAEPSVFNEGQHPWYEPKGLFFPTPTLGFHDGELGVTLPQTGEVVYLTTVESVMDVESRLSSELYTYYLAGIEQEWTACEANAHGTEKPNRIGSVIIEPIFMGAGGMKFVDPLWQRALMNFGRSRGVPIVFDEVASGLYRVGVQSCRELLGLDPDIASYAKLLTGGLIPLSVTLATEDVFETFLGDAKSQALLHGHSYTAHPVGCVSAIHALETFERVLKKGDVFEAIQQWFDVERVQSLSKLPLVQQSFSLGTVLAVTIQPNDSEGSGYAAGSRTTPMVRHLRENGVFARPLGNVIYIMTSPLTSPEECSRLCDVLEDTIRLFGKEM